jgi:hypothetical protein
MPQRENLMRVITDWLTAQGRTRFIAGDMLPTGVRAALGELLYEHWRAIGFQQPFHADELITAVQANAALDWKETADA